MKALEHCKLELHIRRQAHHRKVLGQRNLKRQLDGKRVWGQNSLEQGSGNQASEDPSLVQGGYSWVQGGYSWVWGDYSLVWEVHKKAYLELHSSVMARCKMALVAHMQVQEDCMKASLRVVYNNCCQKLGWLESEHRVQQLLRVEHIGFGHDEYQIHQFDGRYHGKFSKYTNSK